MQSLVNRVDSDGHGIEPQGEDNPVAHLAHGHLGAAGSRPLSGEDLMAMAVELVNSMRGQKA
jgi:hypothetical protein